MISANTKLCAVIGDPVSHTLSPAMHNAAISSLDVDFAYLAFRVRSAELSAAVNGMRALGIRGLNVTIPHKVAVLQFLDELDPLARNIGAVNTIVNEDGKLKGYNTDATGFLQSLVAAGFDPAGKKTVLLGAGGAARAMGFALAQNGADISIMVRENRLEQAAMLTKNLEIVSGRQVTALEITESNLETALKYADLLVNATSAGMTPDAGSTPVPSRLLEHSLTVFDVVYAPLETRLLKEARDKGCATISGLEMLVRQGALAFELWMGQAAPLDVMRQAALTALGEDAHKKSEPGESRRVKTSVALIGFMGSGKSSVGRMLAKKLGKPFVDTDARIEKKTGKSIERIFKEEGETAFRQTEKDIATAISGKVGQVISCGGGMVLDPANVSHLKKHAVLVYLKAAPADIKLRVARSKGKSRRPLLSGTNAAAVDGLLVVRDPIYESSADITLETSGLSVEATAEEIIKRLGEYESFHF